VHSWRSKIAQITAITTAATMGARTVATAIWKIGFKDHPCSQPILLKCIAAGDVFPEVEKGLLVSEADPLRLLPGRPVRKGLSRPTTAGRLPQMHVTKRPFKIAEHRLKFVGLAASPHHPIVLFNRGQHAVGGVLAKRDGSHPLSIR
jgi:hypothetical protein